MKTNLTCRLFLIVAIVSPILTGCATGPKFSPVTSATPEKALVYMYRTSSIVGSANSYKIWINDKHVTDMGNGQYYPYLADPGELVFKMKVKLSPLNFRVMYFFAEKEKEVLKMHVEAGKTYYVKHAWESQVSISNLAVMRLVDERIGAQEILKCKKAKGID